MRCERVTGLATLGIIPKIPSGRSLAEELADLRSAPSEAYRSLCTALQFSTESGLPKTLLVTSAGPSEGKSITALAIARHFATMGLKVLIVDADLRNPSLHTKLGLDNAIGFSNYLTGGCTPPETFQKTDIPKLAVMASGPLPPNAADLLAGSRLFSLLSARPRGVRSHRRRRTAGDGTGRCAVAVERGARNRVRGRRRSSAQRLRAECPAPPGDGTRIGGGGEWLTKYRHRRRPSFGYGYGDGYGYGLRQSRQALGEHRRCHAGPG